MGDALGAQWDHGALTIRFLDPDRRLAGVRLDQRAGLPADRLDLDYDERERAWRLRVPAPDTWRRVYRLRRPDGGADVVCDPGNPRRVGGAYGDRSVLTAPDYAEPGWPDLPRAKGSWQELAIPAPTLDSDVWVRIWSAAAGSDAVLVAHDGPEYDKLAELGNDSAAMVACGRLPAHHLALLAPGTCDEWYSANPVYFRELAGSILPRVRAELNTARPVVGTGASLGALARRYPRAKLPDAHNFTGWREASEPHLTDLLCTAWIPSTRDGG
jgi:enterochelin esterase-like enzyme